MFKVYRLSGFSLMLLLLLILGVFIVGLMLLGPIILVGLLLIFLYIGYRKFRRSINEFIRNIRKKKIKIKNESDNGDVKINFAKTIEINDEKENGKESDTVTLDKQNDSAQKYAEKDQDLSQFINYLKEHGFELKDGILYRGDKIVYPIYKKSYPVNEIIKLYEEKPVCDIVVIGLKGESSNPKFIYILPIDKAKNRISIEELKEYETKLKPSL